MWRMAILPGTGGTRQTVVGMVRLTFRLRGGRDLGRASKQVADFVASNKQWGNLISGLDVPRASEVE